VSVLEATSHNNKVAAFARRVRFGERGTEAAPATSERYTKAEAERSCRGLTLDPCSGERRSARRPES
jgi:hypothetical protein